MNFNFASIKAKLNPAYLIVQRNLRSAIVVLAFLLVSFLLIFGIATIGVQRESQTWLPLTPIARNFTGYQVDVFTENQQLARINPDILNDVRKDAPPTPTPFATVEGTPTPTPTPTATLEPGELQVDIGGPYQGDEGRPISLAATSPDIVGFLPGSISYTWDLDGNGQFDDNEGAKIVTVYPDDSIYTISVQASDVLGRVATDTTTVTVLNVAPIVAIGPDQQSNEAEPVRFNATVEDPGDDALFFRWDFGDGIVSTSDTLGPEHTYRDNGIYTVRLQVKDNDGGISEDFSLVQVLNLPPTVDAGPGQSVAEGSTVTFSGTATDPADDADPLTFAWDLNYDGLNFNTDLTGQTVSAFYSDGPQSYVVALRADDGDGGQTIDTTSLNINNIAPEILAVTTSNPKREGDTISVQVSATDVGSDTLTYAFDWENDGKFEVVNGIGSASRVWPNDGAYTVGVFVEDGDDGQAFSTVDFSVTNLPPLAVATGPSDAVLEGSAANFSAAGTTDPGVQDVLTYRWDFGDGSSGTGPQTSHAYADNGVYSTTLTVTDDAGASSVAFVPVTIDNANPIIAPIPNIIVDEGDNVTIDFSASATDPGTADTLTYEWDFNNDGVFEDGLGPTLSKSFQLDGPENFNVAVRVRDDDYLANRGEPGQAISSLEVTVNNLPPTNIKANVPATGQEGQNIPLIADTALDVISDTLTYEWDIDQDGVYDLVGQTTNYTWYTSANYEVKLRVRDEDGGEGFSTAQITIENGPPVANAGGTYSGNEGSPIALNGTASDPSIPADTLVYTWDLDNNKTFGEAGETGQNVTVTYPDDRPTPYTVTLKVDDGRGGVDTDVAQINVINVAPTINSATASPAGPYTENNTSIIFSGTATDPGADSLTYIWNFQDGTPNFTGNTTPPHNFIDDGIYNVTLTVDDGDGGIANRTVPITVTNLAPTAVITITPPPYREGVPVTLGSGNSSDPSPTDPLSYRWQVSDGAMTQTITNTTNPTITYAFPDNGVYTVTLRADDGDTGLDTDMITVTVQNVAPTTNAGGPYSTTISATINLNATGNDVATDLPLTYSWDLNNNGTFGEAGEVGQTVPFSRTITGTFTVTVRADDGDGGTATNSTTVTVNSVLPLAILEIGYLWFRRKRRNKCLCQRR